MAALAVRVVPALVVQVPVPAGPVVLAPLLVLVAPVVLAPLPPLAGPEVRGELVVQVAASLQERLQWVVPGQRSRPSFLAAMARTTP